MSIFSDNLRFLRKKAGLNQQDISLLFGKGANTIGNWENQKSEPSLNEIIRLGDFFKVNTADLLNRPLEMDYAHALPSSFAPTSRSPLIPRAPSSLAPASPSSSAPGAKPNTYIIGDQETVIDNRESITEGRESNMPRVGSQDPLAAIFRELQEIRDRLDALNKGIETVSLRSGSDKSSH